MKKSESKNLISDDLLSLEITIIDNKLFLRFLRQLGFHKKKSRIRETPTLSTDADRRTDTNLKRLRDLSLKKYKKMRGCVIYLKKKNIYIYIYIIK